MNAPASHVPVLLSEVINALVTDTSGYYIDGTYGRGGHSQAILQHLSTQGHLLAFDKDPEAARHGQQITDKRFSIYHADFTTMATVTDALNMSGKIQGILLDLGISSPQLDTAERGFSFQRNGQLDMRMDTTQGESAYSWLNQVQESSLYKVLKEFGEERYAKKIARAIIAARKIASIETTHQLAEIVKAAHPHWPKDKHPATQTFQAIRMVINQELMRLTDILKQAFTLLKVGGRFAIITFHSLEDQLVKKFIREEIHGNTLFPLVTIPTRLRIVAKAVRPALMEISRNPRARSATLRTLEKIA